VKECRSITNQIARHLFGRTCTAERLFSRQQPVFRLTHSASVTRALSSGRHCPCTPAGWSVFANYSFTAHFCVYVDMSNSLCFVLLMVLDLTMAACNAGQRYNGGVCTLCDPGTCMNVYSVSHVSRCTYVKMLMHATRSSSCVIVLSPMCVCTRPYSGFQIICRHVLL